MTTIIVVYLIIVNVIAFAMYGVDKRKAIKRAYRIPEKQLLGIAVIGGSIGAFLGMKIFRHKTLHLQFSMGIPAIMIVQVILVYVVNTYVYAFLG